MEGDYARGSDRDDGILNAQLLRYNSMIWAEGSFDLV